MADETFREAEAPPRSQGRAATVLINLAVLAVLLLLAEGVLSVVLFSADVLNEKMTPERAHTRYDPDLGWAGIPNLDFPQMYGAGGPLRTNSQGFRGTYDYSAAVPPGKRRIICSGDSVTFGYGVGNDKTWCHLLETIDPGIETINMGQPGYGVDQAYLWYKRDAARFEHQVHLFAPITDDFRRMQSTHYGGYGRPLLVVEDGRLEVRNVPVPTASFRLPWWTETRRHLSSLRSVQAVRRLQKLLRADEASALGLVPNLDRQAERQSADRQAATVVASILMDLKALNDARGSILVVVYLPTLNDQGPATTFWAGVLERECRRLSVPFVNLVHEFDNMPEAAERYYLSDLGHFNEEGNAHIASVLHTKLQALPEVSRALLATAK